MSEREHFMKCGICGQEFDMRDLYNVFLHEHQGLASDDLKGIKGTRVLAASEETKDTATEVLECDCSCQGPDESGKLCDSCVDKLNKATGKGPYASDG